MYYNKNIENIKEELETSEEGLKPELIEKRQIKYGKNILPKKEKDSVFKIFFNEFKDPIVILLLFAALASLMVNEVLDAIAIVFIILVMVIKSIIGKAKSRQVKYEKPKEEKVEETVDLSYDNMTLDDDAPTDTSVSIGANTNTPSAEENKEKEEESDLTKFFN